MASQSNHTPGPFTARGNLYRRSQAQDPDMMQWSSSIDCIAPFTDNEHGNFERHETQAVGTAHGRTREEAEANTHLFAAAPDLLEALIALRNYAMHAVPYGEGHSNPVWAQAANAIAKAKGQR
jgi:hypothetical protein